MVTDRQLCTRTIPFNKRLITSYKSSDVIAANYLHIGRLKSSSRFAGGEVIREVILKRFPI